ncbi:uncharacterized protein C3orf22 homolog isoform X1 [Cervus elaphus]|uniref:uncharacterized protein C3orf22 homolog isoform X1 n=1 Tax=Cervus canadensis TaxID=1574408 RepID=UPI001CA378B0|nr:uncharacterized protein C3orf22 homolog isoform X1 [Cervus canadensis]XP_043741572.1 uncharacterized protein C3orf22 homolog isoform X1 [Cervus elaphus]
MATWPLVKQEGAGVGPGPQGCKSAALPDLSSAASELCGLRASHLPLVCLSVKCPSNTCLPARFPSVESPCAWLGRSPQGPTARRFSWLMGTSSELLQPWELTKMSSLLREQLPLQKTLLPTRSIPVRGLGAPDFLPPSCLQPPLSPPRNLWELALLTRRFPRPAAPPPAPRSPALHHLSLGHSAPRRS